MANNYLTRIIKNNAIVIISIFSFFTAWIYNQINLNHLPYELKRNNETVITSDDGSYLRPAENYLTHNKWEEDYWGAKVGSFIRPPGYGLCYFVFLKTTSSPLFYLKLFQVFLFSVSVYWLYVIALYILNNKSLALIISSIYGLSPFCIGFLFYTLTESITPALLICYTFLLFKAKAANTTPSKNVFYFLAASVFAYLFLVRPVLGIFGILLIVFLINDYRQNLKQLFYKTASFGFIAISLMLIWQIRNYKIAGEYVGLHPIYYEDNNSLFREPFNAYWNFAKGWGEKGDVCFSYMVPLWESAIKGDTSIIHIQKAIQHIPEKVVKHYGEKLLINAFRSYQTAVIYQKTFYDKQLPMPMVRASLETIAINNFNELTEEYKKIFWMDYYILSPVKVFKTMAFHSNLSLFIFQETYRGNGIMEFARILFYAIHILCFLFIIINLFVAYKNTFIWFTLAVAPFIYIFYLCFFQRGIEERYTLPILPFLLIGIIHSIMLLKQKLNVAQ